jgi:hypothetical protein
LNPATFYWSACTKPGKWAVLYLCIKGIDFYLFFWYLILELFLQCGIFCFWFYYFLVWHWYEEFEDTKRGIIVSTNHDVSHTNIKLNILYIIHTMYYGLILTTFIFVILRVKFPIFIRAYSSFCCSICIVLWSAFFVVLFFFWSLYGRSYLDLRLLFTLLVSLSFAC